MSADELPGEMISIVGNGSASIKIPRQLVCARYDGMLPFFLGTKSKQGSIFVDILNGLLHTKCSPSFESHGSLMNRNEQNWNLIGVAAVLKQLDSRLIFLALLLRSHFFSGQDFFRRNRGSSPRSGLRLILSPRLLGLLISTLL